MAASEGDGQAEGSVQLDRRLDVPRGPQGKVGIIAGDGAVEDPEEVMAAVRPSPAPVEGCKRRGVFLG